jgi:2-octaprenyl-6-methoxyphenol hydroxylase
MPATGSVPQDKQCSLVWTVKPTQADDLLALDPQNFLGKLQDVFGNRLGKFVGVSKRASFPLALIQAQRCNAHRAVLLGNASQMLHPIAGQGLNLALRDVANLANTIIATKKGSDPIIDVGQYSLLREYAYSRREDHQKLVTATDLLVRTFSNNYFPLVLGRNLGLSLLDHVSMFKTQLATAAMGFDGRVSFNHNEAH